MRKFGHKHEWQEIARTYAAPVRDLVTMRADRESYQRIMFGVTTVLWKCEGCQSFRKDEMLGKTELLPQTESDPSCYPRS